MFCIIYLGFIVEVGHILFHNMLVYLVQLGWAYFSLHFASFSYIVHIVCELFIVFDHMILILKSNAFDC